MIATRAGLLAALSPVFAALAFAQEASPPAEGPSGSAMIMQQVLMFLPIILIFYFLLIRPQQQRAKQHREMLAALAKGDTVVTSGGLIGKIARIDETEVTIELADNVRVRVVKSMVIDVRNKPVPAAANDSKPA